MLRIWSGTEAGDRTDGALRLRLEGQLRGPWVAELERAVADALASGLPVSLDLSAVSFVDSSGIALLRSLQSRQVTLASCSPFMAEQLRS